MSNEAQHPWSYAAVVQTEETARLIRVLGRPIPLRLLNMVWSEPLCVEFCTHVMGLTQPKVSRGFGELYRLGLVRVRQEGRYRFYWRVNRGMHPVYANFMRMARAVAKDSVQVADDRDQVVLAWRGVLELGDLPWPRRDGWW